MKHTLKLVVLFALLFALVALSFACGIDTKTDDEKIPKVGLLTGTGGLGDNAFNDLCYNGTQMLSADQLKTDVVEPKDYTEMYGLVQQYADAADAVFNVVDAVTAKMASGEIVVPAAIEDVDTFIKTYGNYQ